MPRNRYKYKHTKSSSSAPTSQSSAGKISRAAQRVIERITNGGGEYLLKNAEHILIDSASLAEEPELRDLYLNKEKTAQVSERWLKKYEARLREARKKSGDEFQQVFDDARIKIIDDLASPAFRKLVIKRLEALRDRLLATDDARKIELVLAVGPMLKMKQVPWGICGLIIAIYDRSMKQTLDEFREQDEIIETMMKALKEEGQEVTSPDEILDSPEKLELAGEKLLKANPGLRDRLQKQADEIIDSFRDELMRGNVPLELFTEAELLLPFQRLEKEIGRPIAEMQSNEEMTKRIGQTITQAIHDIMTPERYQRLRKDVETTANAWLRQRQKWAAPLQMESGWLEGDAYEDNPFVTFAFVGQLRQLGGKQKSATQRGKKKR